MHPEPLGRHELGGLQPPGSVLITTYIAWAVRFLEAWREQVQRPPESKGTVTADHHPGRHSGQLRRPPNGRGYWRKIAPRRPPPPIHLPFSRDKQGRDPERTFLFTDSVLLHPWPMKGVLASHIRSGAWCMSPCPMAVPHLEAC